MLQQGQVFRLSGGDGREGWAFRYRVGGRGARRVQRDGFASKRDASASASRRLWASFANSPSATSDQRS